MAATPGGGVSSPRSRHSLAFGDETGPKARCCVSPRAILASSLVAALLAAGHAAEVPFGNPFGMQLRPAPATMAEISAPVILRPASTNETCLVRRRDGTLEIYAIAKPASDAVTVARSRDGGLTWTEAEPAFPLPGKAYYAVQVLEAADGALQAVVHVAGEGPGGYRGRLYEVYHSRRPAGAPRWSEPRRIVPGYVGSIRGFTQLQGGRILLAVARAIPEREKAPAAGPDHGWNDTFVYYTDDGGATWLRSPDVLSLQLAGPSTTRYGAIEPVLLELRDRVWMLVRDRGGRLWESHSPTGERWAPLAPSRFISSDSPAALLRLRDGRIVLFTNACQNWSDPRSYALGGREVLHAAISRDDGKSWRGFREVLHETLGGGRGDRGTAYPSAVENDAGKVVFASGQGEGKRAVVAFDPRWLEESGARDELSRGPEGWTQYGAEGLRVTPLAEGGQAVVIPAGEPRLGGALWNFPLATAGELSLRLQVDLGVSDLRICLSDHFNRIDDEKAAEHAVYALDGLPLLAGPGGPWRNLQLTWRQQDGAGVLSIALDGRKAGQVAARGRAPLGVNYLRVEARGTGSVVGVRVRDLRMEGSP